MKPDALDGMGEVVEWLYGTQLFGVKLGLDGMQRLAGALGVSLGGVGAPRFIHVAGTNGKGSTCALIESVCRSAGWRTGLYTSPHLVSLRERFRLDGELISEDELCDGLRRIRELVSGWEPHPTFFEIVTALALEWFQRKGAEWVVLETGMGGRLDATNVVIPAVSVLTPVGLDHQQYLGTGLAQIAFEKAGIIKPGVPAVSAPQAREVLDVFERVAQEKRVSLRMVSEPWQDGPVGLAGSVQRWNAALAVAAIEAAGLHPGAEVTRSGIARVQWRGRFQRLSADLIVDGAHNPAAAEALVETWCELHPGEKASIVFGALQDKDAGAVLERLAPITADLTLVQVQSPRSIELRQLREIAAGVFRVGERVCKPEIFEAPDLASALARSSGGLRRLVTGSLYLVGEALALHAGTVQERSAQ
jgi:dihydrofolate synthase / folylpolyglutamate synthase